MKNLVDKLSDTHNLSDNEFKEILLCGDKEFNEYLFGKARNIREKHYGKIAYLRGLIEFTNHCKNNCYYCGIRCANRNAQRYRLSKKEILDCCKAGYDLGFRTFVLQGFSKMFGK